jgi:hypothetical protein
MARISTYIKDNAITDGDKLIGTDAANKGRTVNITVGSLKTFMEENAEFNGETTIFNQNTASSIWTVEHNLEKFPSVTAIDSSGGLIIGEINYQNNNSLTINFSAPLTGTAYLN